MQRDTRYLHFSHVRIVKTRVALQIRVIVKKIRGKYNFARDICTFYVWNRNSYIFVNL